MMAEPDACDMKVDDEEVPDDDVDDERDDV